MGFDREITLYNCGCYYEYYSHDSFNYTRDQKFVNVCGNHVSEYTAMEDQRNEQNKKKILEQATDVLTEKWNLIK